MSASLQYLPLENLGVNGLNTQTNPSALEPSWLTKADNIVIRESGKIGFRKGLKQQVLKHTSGKPIGALIEHTYTSGGADFTETLCAVDGKMSEVDFTTPGEAFPTSAAHTTPVSTDDWQMIEFNNKVYSLQTGSAPIEYNQGTWETTTTKPAGFDVAALFDPSCGMGHYGRMWVGGITSTKDVLYYSDTLLGDTWTTGNSGFIDLKTVWGADEIVAIQPFYGKIAIFGKHNIVIYSNPWAATGSNYATISAESMSLDEVIRGIGCASRDSVQAVGDDLFFLSATGLRSLARTTEKENLPLQDLSLNIKDSLIRTIQRSSNAKGVYVENEGVYILSFVDVGETYVFDIKSLIQTGNSRITTWTFDKVGKRQPSCLFYSDTQGLLVGQNSGSIATYEGFFDNVIDSVTTEGTPVRTNYPYSTTLATIWIDLGQSTVASLLKKLKATFDGGRGTTVAIKWYKDFEVQGSKVHTINLKLPVNSSEPSLFGSSLWSCNTEYDYGGTGFCSIGAYDNTNSDMTLTNETDCVAVTGNVWNETTDTGTESEPIVDQPTNCTTDIAKYAQVLGMTEYNVPLTGSAKHLKLEITAPTNGFEVSLQNLTLLTKQGRIR